VLYRPSADELQRLNIDPEAFAAGSVRVPPLKTKLGLPPRGMLFAARDGGCSRCSKSGYIGRMGIYELLLMNNDIRQLALKNTDSNTIKQAAVDQGMRTLRDDGAAKVLAGVTTIEEVMMVTAEDKQ
jgi:general secretion pathway protein E